MLGQSSKMKAEGGLKKCKCLYWKCKKPGKRDIEGQILLQNLITTPDQQQMPLDSSVRLLSPDEYVTRFWQ